MKRRALLLAAVGTLASERLVAQPRANPYRFGMLLVANVGQAKAYLESFHAGMRDYGYIPGKDYVVDQRYDSAPRLDELAGELVAAKPDLLLATEVTSMFLRRKTQAIPIVMLISA